jgi:tRNA (guanine-N7-)-methyltransferase
MRALVNHLSPEILKPSQQSAGILTLDQITQPLNWASLFATVSPGPVELEVGTGRGDFLLRWSATNPHLRLLGVDMKTSWLQRAHRKLVRAQLANAILLVADAGPFLTQYVPANSLRAVHVYFPDPWPKRRHAPRRFFQPQTPEVLTRVLENGGALHFRTDHRDYFEATVPMFDDHPQFEHFAPPPELLACQTGYERRFRAEGLVIYRASYRWTGPGGTPDPTFSA